MYSPRQFICKQCGKACSKRCISPKFCSFVCRNASLSARQELSGKWPRKQCPICGDSFRPYGNSNTCSMRCKLKKGVIGKTRLCVSCGSSFVAVYPTSMQKYCSRLCASRGKNKSPYEFDCAGCGKHVSMRSIGTRKRTYCTRECQRKHMVGPNNPLWRGNRRHDRGPTWKAQSRTARERDQYCIAPGCGKNESELGQKLSVDHIVPFRLTVQYGAENGVDPNHLDNLACLCRSHHQMKTMAERKLLRGDIVGFRAAVATIFPLERVNAALRLWGLA